MDGKILTEEELKTVAPGEAITIAAVMAVMAIAVMAVVVYKLMRSQNGADIKMPGGFQFTWK
ncbi:MAG: hypothetical protein MJ241_04040 [Bacilli bacterium]|nr:hypothetical protein [Bacilli bacterium]